MLNLSLSLVSYLVCFGVLRILSSSKKLVNLLADQANARSLHVGAKPRLGGAGIVIGLSVSFVLSAIMGVNIGSSLALTAFAYVALFLVSLLDDAKSLSALTRLTIHIAIISVWVWLTDRDFQLAQTMISSPLSNLLFPLTVLGITWATNLYNFMDGADGLAGSMSVIGFSSYAIAAQYTGAIKSVFR
jgi:UDP-GlcNAc:undecaprenyl-phosphate/decaprenyl-phosphate GlcNAc-1-phosphate transferase